MQPNPNTNTVFHFHHFKIRSAHGNKGPLRKCNIGKSTNIKMGWLSHVDEKMSFLTFGMGFGIGFGGVVSMFMLWERTKNWVLCLPHNK